MVGTTLRVVLDDEDRRGRPELRSRQRRHDPAEGDIVVGHVRVWGRRPGARVRGVIVGEPQDLQARHVAGFLPLRKLGQPCVGALLVGDVEVVAGIGGTRVLPLELLQADVAIAPSRPVHAGGHGELAEIPEADSRLLGEVPQVAARRPGHVVVIVVLHAVAVRALVIVRPAATRVVARDRPFGIVGHVGSHAPLVAVGTHFGVHEKAVVQPKTLGERMMIRRPRAREKQQRRVAVAAGKVGEHLVVRAVLLHDVEHMLDGRIGKGVARRTGAVPAVGAPHAGTERGELGARGPRERRDHQRAGELAECVLAPAVEGVASPGLGVETREAHVGPRAAPLAVDHKQGVAGSGDGGRIPVCRNAPREGVAPGGTGHAARARAELEDANGIRVTFGHEQARAVARQGETGWRAPLTRSRRGRIEQRGEYRARSGIDHDDAVRAR